MVRARAAPEAGEAELRSQVDAALAAGIDVTHLDDHMGTALAPKFVAAYLRMAADYHLPPWCAPRSPAMAGRTTCAG